MNKKQREDYVATYNQFSLEAPHVPGGEMRDLLDKLHRAETTLHRIAEMVCSVEMSEVEEARLQRKDDATEKRVEKIAERLGVGNAPPGNPRFRQAEEDRHQADVTHEEEEVEPQVPVPHVPGLVGHHPVHLGRGL